jgi:hypothetical protein
MRQISILVAAAALVGVLASSQSAFAQYGAIAYDENTGRYGVTWNHESPRGASEDALRRCGTPDCTIRLEIGPGMCGALATTENRRGWGRYRDRSRESARDGALEECRRHNFGECFVRVWDCNR